MSVLQGVSTLVVILIGLGVVWRKRRKAHLGLMGTAFVLDLLLVLYIEGTRHAVDKAIHATGPLLIFHIAVSVGVLVAYGVQIFLGVRLLRGQESRRGVHARAGAAFLILRLTNYVTSFLIV